jgi:hypothetical protein
MWHKNVGRKLVFAGVLLLFSAALISCTSIGPGGKRWTVAIYLCGSNLETRQGWATKTLEELEGAHIPDDVSVVVQAGGAKEWESDEVPQNGCRLEVRNGTAAVVGQATEASMGAEGTLADFLQFVQESHPASHTAVVLWDHGGGPLVGACFDETSDFDALTLPELNEAFAVGVKARGGQPYDIVGFDACLMGSLETAALLADDAHWLVGSEEIETGAGWDYGALINALGSDSDAQDACEAICDGYVDKSARRRKDAMATLAAVDLSKIANVCDALGNALATTRSTKGDDTAALRALAYGVRQAESFGGASDNEGHTNLVDLLGAARQAMTSPEYGSSWQTLADALEQAVPYHVCGKATSGANGLSLWYPVSATTKDVASYMGVSPLTAYASALSELFLGGIEPLEVIDAGSIGDDGSLSVTIDPKSAGSFFDLYVVNRRADGTYADTNVDIHDDWEGLTFTYDPSKAVAITLDGMPLDASVIGYGSGFQTFSSPVQVNGRTTNLRTSWIMDDGKNGGHYEVLGTWDGIDELTGLADRSLDDLENGAEVGAVSKETGEVRDHITLGPTPTVDEVPMAPGSYECWFVALDLLGNEHESSKVTYEVLNDGTTRIMAVGGVPVAQ